MTTLTVLREVLAERRRQEDKFGEQSHPDGTGPDHVWAFTGPASFVADCARSECGRLFEEGYGTWLAVLREEIAEAFAESDPAKIREELIQVAAVAVNWAEHIDRRTGRTAAPAPRPDTAPDVTAIQLRAVEILTGCPVCGSTAAAGCLQGGVGNVPGFRHPELALLLGQAMAAVVHGSRDLR